MNARTIYQVLKETAAVHGDAPALRQPLGKGNDLTYSWNEYRRAAEEIAAGLCCLGAGKGDIVGLHSETRLELYLADLGIMTNGSVSAALYPSFPAADLVRTIEAACAKIVFEEDAKAFSQLRAACVAHWILLTGPVLDGAERVRTLEQLRDMGRAVLCENPALLERLSREVQPTDPAILYLTSGATGEPKMVLVSHQAVVANLDMGPTMLPLGPEDSTVAFLPSAHIAQRVVMELLPLRSGMPVTFSESLLKLPQQIRKARPTMLLAPPRMCERIYSTICTELRKRPAPVRRAFYGAIGLALAAARYRREGKAVPRRLQAPLRIAVHRGNFALVSETSSA